MSDEYEPSIIESSEKAGVAAALIVGQWRGKVDTTLKVLSESAKETNKNVADLDKTIVELREKVTRLVVLMGVGGGVVTMMCSIAVALIVRSISR